MLADLSAAEWGGIVVAIGTAVSPVLVLVFREIYKLVVENNKTKLEIKKLDAATAKTQATRLVKDQAETIKEQSQAMDQRSVEVNRWRDVAHAAEVKVAFNEARLAELEKVVADYGRRLDECEEDRARMWEAMGRPPQKGDT